MVWGRGDPLPPPPVLVSPVIDLFCGNNDLCQCLLCVPFEFVIFDCAILWYLVCVLDKVIGFGRGHVNAV